MPLELVVDNTKKFLAQKSDDWQETHIIALPQKREIFYHFQKNHPGERFASLFLDEDSPYYVNIHGLHYHVDPDQVQELSGRFERYITRAELVLGPIVCYGTGLLLGHKRDGINILYANQKTFPDPIYCRGGKLMSTDEALNK